MFYDFSLSIKLNTWQKHKSLDSELETKMLNFIGIKSVISSLSTKKQTVNLTKSKN
jgi:hypothetical protein